MSKLLSVFLGLCFLVLGACQAAAGDLKEIKSGDNYKVQAAVEREKANPNKGLLAVEMLATGGWKFDTKPPVLLDITAPDTVQIANKKLRRPDLKLTDLHKMRFEVPFEQTVKGAVELTLSFNFVLCDEKVCQQKRFELAYPL
jgi:hypothetical protein